MEKKLTDYKGGNVRLKIQFLPNPNYSSHKTTRKNRSITEINI
jgi:hypothetical protein